MITILPSMRRIALLGSIACAAAMPATAATFLTFSGTGYVSGTDKHLQGDTLTYISASDKYGEPDGYPLPSALVGRAFSDVTAFSPTSGYSGPAFYGAASVTSSDATDNEGFHALAVANGGGGDSIHWTVDSNAGDTHSAHLFVYFQQSEFDTPYNTGTITGADMASASFELHTGQLSQSGPNDTALFWVVKDAGQFYVAQTPTLIAQNTGYLTTWASISGWALYDPSTSLAAIDFNEASTFSAHTFTDIEGFGFYVEHESGASSSHGDIDAFIVNVPEPSRAMLLLGGLLPFIFRRRR